MKREIANFIQKLERKIKAEKTTHERHLKRVLTQLKAEIDGNENSTIIEHQEIKNELKKLENERFEHWKKTNRLSEIYEGEQISLAMIQKAKIKREENIMKRLKQDDGKIIEEETQIRVQVRDYYRKIYKRKENLDIGGIFYKVSASLMK